MQVAREKLREEGAATPPPTHASRVTFLLFFVRRPSGQKPLDTTLWTRAALPKPFQAPIPDTRGSEPGRADGLARCGRRSHVRLADASDPVSGPRPYGASGA